MSATKSASVLQSLELDSSIIDSLPEALLSELIGFIEYDSRLSRRREELARRREEPARRREEPARRREEQGIHCTQQPPVLNIISWRDR